MDFVIERAAVIAYSIRLRWMCQIFRLSYPQRNLSPAFRCGKESILWTERRIAGCSRLMAGCPGVKHQYVVSVRQDRV